MNIQFLEKNPFYLLDVMPTDTRATIVAHAEEKSFQLGDDICSEAQASLLNPSKRLAAEIDWFYDCDEDDIYDIRLSIKCAEATEIETIDNLTGLSKLNAMLLNFAVSDFDDEDDICCAIKDIDEQYSTIDEVSIASVINACRSKAGLLPVSCDEVGRELKKKREQSKHLISDKIFSLEENDYIKLVRDLAKDYDCSPTPGLIIDDIVDQYELKMQTSIETASNEITAFIERIKRIANKEGIEANLTGLIKKVKKWDKLTAPLPQKSTASGVDHHINKVLEDIGWQIRDFALWLHNEQDMTEQALTLVNSMQDVLVFTDILDDVFAKDAAELRKILDERKEFNQILEGIKGIADIINKRGAGAITDNTVSDMIAKVKSLNARIKVINADDETITKLRTNLCCAVRNAAIYVHNEKRQTASALSIAKMLLAEFGDIEELRGQLSEDVKVLSSQLAASNVPRPAPPSSRQPSRSGSFIGGWIIAAIIIFVIFSSISKNDSSYRDQPRSEVGFSISMAPGTNVYADIVSIFPSIGIYSKGSSYYKYFVCECKTSTGSAVWVYMSASEYKNYFDANVSTSTSVKYHDGKTYTYARRIHGKAKRADSVLSGISSEIRTNILIDFDYVDSP